MKVLGGLYGWSHGRGLRQQMATEEDMTTQPCIWNPAPSKFLLLCRWWNEMVVTSIFTHQHPKTKSDSRRLALCDAYQLTSHDNAAAGAEVATTARITKRSASHVPHRLLKHHFDASNPWPTASSPPVALKHLAG